MPEPGLTKLINEWQNGGKEAEAALFEAMYKMLHDLAVRCMRTERPGRSLGATGLVHEAYLRFRRSHRIEFTDRVHFLTLAARVMRRILVDRARARSASIRAGIHVDEELADSLVRNTAEAEEILSVDRALDELASVSPRQRQLVELRYFAGYTFEESAAILGIAERTARRDWIVARTRLKGLLDGSSG